MKTLTSLIFLAVNAALGQSSFWLSNANGPLVNAPVFDAQGVNLEGPRYLVELWGGATPDSLTPAIAFYTRQRVVIPFLAGASAGYFRDSYVGRDGADHPTILAVPPFTSSAWLQVRAWDARLGDTYEEVVARGLGGYGESVLFSAQGTDPRDLLGIPAPLAGLQSFRLREVVPEPSAALLMLLGLPLLICKRHPGHLLDRATAEEA